ncbi:Carboxyl-terminal-processing peptidase 2, chloroplastic [Heracleum sosnowskyi]|uniref:C-terminal processing peptidase n=1 Tax=Heracleum sosnowskyi TaxID=360622 RepID=A0AAD8J0C5_9APIA|nr:Carboxyl-terminal-processing peptidase 2, chloroplastic [Heracleum sosnowskyi]
MVLLGCSVRPSKSSLLSSNPNFSYKVPSNSFVVSSVDIKIWNCLSCVRLNASVRKQRFVIQSIRRDSNAHLSAHGFYLPRKFSVRVRKAVKFCVGFRERFPIIVFQFVVGVMLFMAVAVPVSKSPSWALTEENLLFLEAWRTIDRAYVDKTFNGQSWFRYRENALRNEPMNNREETYVAIRKMLSTLDDPFTRFLEPEKFKSLRSGTKGALTGVGLSIGYPTKNDSSPPGLVVISSAPGGPANRAGVLSGDIIMAIDNTSTETMDIYDAAERLQGTDGSAVELTISSGLTTRHLSLKREKVSLNPVKSRICEISGTGKDASRIGYIKLSSFNENASGAVREAIDDLRRDNVSAFILDLRDNSGGLFPEGIKIAQIWLDKGVIVYICDSRGVRDIYDTDGSNAIAASEPLVVLVNKGTASASEILAGALKDNKRAVLLGEPTFGKGKIQSVFELSDGSGMAVTVARYETPAHTDINKVGIIPDHPLPASFPKDEDNLCGCLQDPTSGCYLDRFVLFLAASSYSTLSHENGGTVLSTQPSAAIDHEVPKWEVRVRKLKPLDSSPPAPKAGPSRGPGH